MRNFFVKYGHVVAAIALMFTGIAANRCCFFSCHQPELPAEAKNLRKF